MSTTSPRSYLPDTAGAIMSDHFICVPESFTVQQTIDFIRSNEDNSDNVYAVCVLDQDEELLQAVPLRRLVMAKPDAPVLSAARHSHTLSVSPEMSRREVAKFMSEHNLLGVPVVDDIKVVGLVTVDNVIDAMMEEITEDVHKFGGVEALSKPYMEIGFMEMLSKRGGWLCVLFLSEMLTASAMQSYQNEMSKAIVLTLFIPLVMSSGGNSGSQATSLMIRALALKQIRLGDWWRVALKELPTGIALGGLLGGVAMIRITVWQNLGFFNYGPHWMLLAGTIATALMGIVTFGSMAGSMLPFILMKLKFDPASASAPFVATLVDVTGLVIYFSIAALILGGTLL